MSEDEENDVVVKREIVETKEKIMKKIQVSSRLIFRYDLKTGGEFLILGLVNEFLKSTSIAMMSLSLCTCLCDRWDVADLALSLLELRERRFWSMSWLVGLLGIMPSIFLAESSLRT